MTFRFFEEAREELLAAFNYYESILPNLGSELINEVERTIDRLLLHPESAPVLTGIIRKAVLSRFPFNLLYIATDTEIVIVAVMHQKRRPGYWKNRQ